MQANATFAALVGLDPSALVGRSFPDLLTGGSRLYHETHYAPLVTLQGGVEEVAADLEHADGTSRPVLLSSVLHPGDAELEARIGTSVMAAPHRRRFEAEVQQARRRAEASEQRVALLHRLVAGLVRATDVEDVAAVVQAELGRDDDASTGLWTSRDPDGPDRRRRRAVDAAARAWAGHGPGIDEAQGVLVLPIGPRAAPTAVAGIDLARLLVDGVVGADAGGLLEVEADLLSTIAGEVHQALVRARLFERKDWLLGVAAHDLRTPLTIMVGNATTVQRILEDLPPDATNDAVAQELLERIVAVGNDMAALIGDVLDLAAVESGELRLARDPTDVAAVVRDAVTDHAGVAAAKDITLEVDVPQGVEAVSLDPRRILQVLDNLLSNAIKYSERDTTVRVRLVDEVDRVEVLVADEGQGIPADEVAQVFQPFRGTSTEPTGGERSTGLGLSIASAIVAAHGGRIDVDSTVGVGSTFRFTLPRPADSD